MLRASSLGVKFAFSYRLPRIFYLHSNTLKRKDDLFNIVPTETRGKEALSVVSPRRRAVSTESKVDVVPGRNPLFAQERKVMESASSESLKQTIAMKQSPHPFTVGEEGSLATTVSKLNHRPASRAQESESARDTYLVSLQDIFSLKDRKTGAAAHPNLSEEPEPSKKAQRSKLVVEEMNSKQSTSNLKQPPMNMKGDRTSGIGKHLVKPPVPDQRRKVPSHRTIPAPFPLVAQTKGLKSVMTKSERGVPSMKRQGDRASRTGNLLVKPLVPWRPRKAPFDSEPPVPCPLPVVERKDSKSSTSERRKLPPSMKIKRNQALAITKVSVNPLKVEPMRLPSNAEIPAPPHPPYFRENFNTLRDTKNVEEAWDAYSTLLALPRPSSRAGSLPKIPFLFLHRLARLLTRTRPRTRDLFLRLLSVLSNIHKAGGTVHLDEWNALLNCAGRGWRRTRPVDFKLVLNIFSDMLAQRVPGARVSGNEFVPQESLPAKGDIVKPDIVTYTTLLNIAGRTLTARNLNHAAALLKSSGLSPNRITHLVMLRYFTHTQDLAGVRDILQKMRAQDLACGVDGLNACIWAYGHLDRVDIARSIYRLLRHAVIAEDNVTGIDEVRRHLADREGIVLPPGIVPDEITYTTMLQTLSYRGDLIGALRVFMDMLTAPLKAGEGRNSISPANADKKVENVTSPFNHPMTFPAFRGIFLGFARHGQPSQRDARSRLNGSLDEYDAGAAWTLEKLQPLFDSFMGVSGNTRPTSQTIYWIMTAFHKTTGYNKAKLREVWSRMDAQFGEPVGGPGERLVRMRRALFDTEGHSAAK